MSTFEAMYISTIQVQNTIKQMPPHQVELEREAKQA
jgi:hypothetical protein